MKVRVVIGPNRWSAHMALQSDSNEMQYITLSYIRLHILKNELHISTLEDSTLSTFTPPY